MGGTTNSLPLMPMRSSSMANTAQLRKTNSQEQQSRSISMYSAPADAAGKSMLIATKKATSSPPRSSRIASTTCLATFGTNSVHPKQPHPFDANNAPCHQGAQLHHRRAT